MKYRGESEKVPLKKNDIDLIKKRLRSSYGAIGICFGGCVLLGGSGFYATSFIGIPVILGIVFLVFVAIFLSVVGKVNRDLASGLKIKISGILTNKETEVSSNTKSKTKTYYFYIGTEKVQVQERQYDVFPIADELTIYLAEYSKTILEIRNDTEVARAKKR